MSLAEDHITGNSTSILDQATEVHLNTVARGNRKRGNGRQFAPGQTGNPNGRPETAELRAYLKPRTVEMCDILLAIARDKRHRDRAKAAIAVLDRAWGTPVQYMEIGGGSLADALDAIEARIAETDKGKTIEAQAVEIIDDVLPEIVTHGEYDD